MLLICDLCSVNELPVFVVLYWLVGCNLLCWPFQHNFHNLLHFA